MKKKRLAKDAGDHLDNPDGPLEPQLASEIPLRPIEVLLIESLADVKGPRILCNTAGRGQLAVTIAEANPANQVECWFLDIYQHAQAQKAKPTERENLQYVCQADLPDGPFNTIVLALPSRGEAELTRELLQAAYMRLAPKGKLIAATDAPEDRWLNARFEELFPKVTRRPIKKKGIVYLGIRSGDLKKVKSYDCEFMFRDRGKLLKAKTRPGVFSHRHVDPGARHLINNMHLLPASKVVDLGCGSGVVSLAAAAISPNIEVLAIDSNPRALECVDWGAKENQLTNITTLLDSDGTSVPSGQFDVVLANPPYFSNYRIAEVFLQTSLKALKPKGKLQLVTKAPNWYAERMPELFNRVEVTEVKDYFIVSGIVPPPVRSIAGRAPASKPASKGSTKKKANPKPKRGPRGPKKLPPEQEATE